MAGRIVGPFSSPPFANFVSSSLGVVPKKTPGEFRIIHHLSYPESSSVNDFIPSEKSTVHYASIRDAIAIIHISLIDVCLWVVRPRALFFEAFSTPLEWLAKHFLGASGVLHILDDFLFIAASQSQNAGQI